MGLNPTTNQIFVGPGTTYQNSVRGGLQRRRQPACECAPARAGPGGTPGEPARHVPARAPGAATPGRAHGADPTRAPRPRRRSCAGRRPAAAAPRCPRRATGPAATAGTRSAPTRPPTRCASGACTVRAPLDARAGVRCKGPGRAARGPRPARQRGCRLPAAAACVCRGRPRPALACVLCCSPSPRHLPRLPPVRSTRPQLYGMYMGDYKIYGLWVGNSRAIAASIHGGCGSVACSGGSLARPASCACLRVLPPARLPRRQAASGGSRLQCLPALSPACGGSQLPLAFHTGAWAWRRSRAGRSPLTTQACTPLPRPARRVGQQRRHGADRVGHRLPLWRLLPHLQRLLLHGWVGQPRISSQ